MLYYHAPFVHRWVYGPRRRVRRCGCGRREVVVGTALVKRWAVE